VTLRESIFTASDIATEIVKIPEWNVALAVKSMNGEERGRLMSSLTDANGKPDMARAITDVVIFTAHDPETGERLFTEADRDALNQKSGAALQKVAEVGMRLSGLTPDSVDESGKDSSSTPNVGSPLS